MNYLEEKKKLEKKINKKKEESNVLINNFKDLLSKNSNINRFEMDTYNENDNLKIEFFMKDEKGKKKGSSAILKYRIDDKEDLLFYNLNIPHISQFNSDMFKEENNNNLKNNITTSYDLYNIGNNIKEKINEITPILKELKTIEKKVTGLKEILDDVEEILNENRKEFIFQKVKELFEPTKKSNIEETYDDIIKSAESFDCYINYITLEVKEENNNTLIKFKENKIEAAKGAKLSVKINGNRGSKSGIKEVLNDALTFDGKICEDFEFLNKLMIYKMDFKKQSDSVTISEDDFFKNLKKNNLTPKEFVKNKQEEKEFKIIIQNVTNKKKKKMGLISFK